jgi:hypothetical protein
MLLVDVLDVLESVADVERVAVAEFVAVVAPTAWLALVANNCRSQSELSELETLLTPDM